MTQALLRGIARGFLELVLPPSDRCPLCGGPLRRAHETGVLLTPAPATSICRSCLASNPPIIKHIAHPLQLPRACHRDYSTVMAAGPYEGRLKEAIWRLKYGGRQDLCEPLGSLMAEAGLAAVRGGAVAFDVLVPVPLHPAREVTRGFNQSLLLSKVAGGRLGVPVEAGELRRTRETLPQSTLDQHERRRNISGAFTVLKRGWFGGKRVLIVDDVFTTGATVFECCAVLLCDGAASVDVLVCAITGG
ncbi:MAG: ComF family protein [Firmicutes bacterium]|nr:ComF family protein [Bacillota bacterium]